jgi:dCMP deaminase
MAETTPKELEKQLYYRDARTKGYYDKIWKSVGKCVFCDLRQKYIFYEENGIVMTVALFAYIDGNFMIVPRRHIKSVKELSDSEWKTVRKMMYMAKKVIKKTHQIKGMQFILRDGGAEAQSTVSDHLHIHCIPFDAPDLSVWNFRELKFTPLENANLYRHQASFISKLADKFDKQYGTIQAEPADTMALYKDAVRQALANKKQSQAKKTAKVGAAVVAGNKVVSMFNINLASGSMDLQKDDGTWTSPPTVAHAEERCIAQAAKEGIPLGGATMVVTLSPCMTCSRLIVNSGIKQLHYIDEWWDKQALEFLGQNGVKVVKLTYKKKGGKNGAS